VTTERVGPPVTGGEREMLRAFLDYHRATLAMKCDGLSDEQLRRQSMPPSTLSLLGLVRHMAEGEHQRFTIVLGGDQVSYPYYADDNRTPTSATWTALTPPRRSRPGEPNTPACGTG
jgi:uncharacterized protein DUF664